MLYPVHPSGIRTPQSLLFAWGLLASRLILLVSAHPLGPRQAQSVFSQALPSLASQYPQSGLSQQSSIASPTAPGSGLPNTAFPFAIDALTETVFVTAIPSTTPSTSEAGPVVTITYTIEPTPTSAPLPDASSPLPSRGPQLIPHIPSPSSSPSSPTTWSVPPIYTNFDTFSVTHYAGGQSNMEIVIATASPAASPRSIAKRYPEATVLESAVDTTESQDRSILRVLYPEGSINPASRPQGGAQFYASPLDITQAQSVTLEYDVYFPADFEFVLGGKLPGLFGGKESCSGGDAALDCFSTRLMWREEGAGELYLYAPKDKQTEDLCSLPPESVCESSYGLSIARGSFNWTRGGWTHVAQTVALNTPGVQDGEFRLEVDGAPVINRRDVYYRSAGGDSDDEDEGDEDEDDDKGLIGGLLPTLGKLLGRAGSIFPFVFGPQSVTQSIVAQSADAIGEAGTYQSRPKAKAKVKAADVDSDAGPIGFTGLFFSTFFGGHEPEWASPKDQYVHFASFAMRIND